MYEIEMYRCVKEIWKGVLHRGEVGGDGGGRGVRRD